MKTIKMAGALVSVAESLAKCITCNEPIPIADLEPRWIKSKTGHLRYKCPICKCKTGITCNYMGDFVSYDLTIIHPDL